MGTTAPRVVTDSVIPDGAVMGCAGSYSLPSSRDRWTLAITVPLGLAWMACVIVFLQERDGAQQR